MSSNPFAVLGALDPDEATGSEAKVKLKNEYNTGFTGLLNQYVRLCVFKARGVPSGSHRLRTG